MSFATVPNAPSVVGRRARRRRSVFRPIFYRSSPDRATRAGPERIHTRRTYAGSSDGIGACGGGDTIHCNGRARAGKRT